jgi:hypothetical protein
MRRKRTKRDDRTLHLFLPNAGGSTPNTLSAKPGRFPLNDGGDHVENWVLRDLKDAADPLVVAGYASLDRFLDFAAGISGEASARFLLGNEPFASRRTEHYLTDDSLPEQAEKYWLGRGISLVRSAALIRTIGLLRLGRVQARYMRGGRMLHAKIYCSELAATVGSSNFTEPGLVRQHEANARFERDSEPERYVELKEIAEGFWRLGVDYSQRLIALLEMLLKPVHWDEALARACSELLEGDWASDYLTDDYLGGSTALWPSQRQGIAQALAILDQRGSVLLADATGAGKTKMGVYLVGAIRDQGIRSGRLWNGKALMIAPPTVLSAWEDEVTRSKVHLEVRSHGVLSNKVSRQHELRVEELKRAQTLCVDEGHNFLNLASQRTQLLLRNMADHVVMLTATPINRGVLDLLRIADVLGADNLEESTLSAFKKLLGRTTIPRPLTPNEAQRLREELRKFTVRRTKSMINALIDREPDAYTNKLGKPCRFPRHNPRVYRLDEPAGDRKIATLISTLAGQLYGATHFAKPIEMPAALKALGITEAQYIRGRLASAKKLSHYLVMRSLRSSSAALLEHVWGTEAALQKFSLQDEFRKDASGNQSARLKAISGHPPSHELKAKLPDWLSNAEDHKLACDHDLRIYEDIARLAGELSGSRLRKKVELLQQLLSKHALVLAFDSRPITLAITRQHLTRAGVDVLLAWGDPGSDRDKLIENFRPGSASKGLIGLCSDSLAEGVNLQQAAAIVHLDLPSVVRIAEQRVGRVDRLDSPHESIEAWWPQDGEEFALTSDERLIERFETVEALIGSNMPLPEHLQPSTPERRNLVSPEQLIAELESASSTPWDGIEDAFAPVRDLVSGPTSLVSPEVYERFRKVTERVLSRVSLVSAETSWAFFCLRAGSIGAPRWVFLGDADGAIDTELVSVSHELRSRLTPETKNLQFDDRAVAVLNRFLVRLPTVEKALLSQKKQRAIDQLVELAKDLASTRLKARHLEDVAFLRKLIELLDDSQSELLPDWNEVASRWLDVIRPVWFEKLKEKRTKPLLLRDIRKSLESDPDWLMAQIRKHFATIPSPKRIDERVKACIIGVS